MENANDICRLALRRRCGQAMSGALPRERLHCDSRCSSLMPLRTAERCVDRAGGEYPCEAGEREDAIES